MAASVFVSREAEIAKLQSFLDRARAGQAQVAFLSGEAGTGKTALLLEFARRTQMQPHAPLIAMGTCNAYTGLGDPYLPFREILALLTGDVDAKLAQGLISLENANRLRGVVVRSLQILVEVGSDLINVLLPGAQLVAKIGRAVLKKAGWMDKLEQIVRAQRKSTDFAESAAEQGRLFEQYTNFLCQLAGEQPLLLILDDLQWADVASINLLFHLGRRAGTAPILILGAYRSDELSLGRAGERHPLDKVQAEFKRYFGEIVLDLRQAMETEGQHFVNALLRTQPNRLGEGFRQALFAHTEGHPLFTVELLRALQEQGFLIRDPQARWIETPMLDWAMLPVQVEGVIEERIARLAEEQRQLLSIASVEGENFTAQIVARVQELRERQVVQTLSQELEKRHRLIQEQGEIQVGRQHLSRYRFAHSLFQHYLYSELGVAERRLLHGEIARALEELYAGQKDEALVQLAHHYDAADEDEKAIEYLFAAGSRARRLYANQEAIAHMRRALALLVATTWDETRRAWQQEMAVYLQESLGDLLLLTGQAAAAQDAFVQALAAVPPADLMAQARLHRKLGKCQTLQRHFEAAVASFRSAHASLGSEPPFTEIAWWQEWCEIQVEEMMAYYWVSRPDDIKILVDKTRPIVEQHGTLLQRAGFFKGLTSMELRRDRYVVSVETLEHMRNYLTAQEQLDNPSERAYALFLDGFTWLWYGDFDQAEAQMQAALQYAERIGDVTVQARCLTYLTVLHRKRGALEQVQQLNAKSLELAAIANMPEYGAVVKAMSAWLAWRSGSSVEVTEQGKAALADWQSSSLVYPFQWLALWPLMAVAVAQNQVAEAMEYTRMLLVPTQLQHPAVVEAPLQEALRQWDSGQPAVARRQLERAVQLAQSFAFL